MTVNQIRKSRLRSAASLVWARDGLHILWSAGRRELGLSGLASALIGVIGVVFALVAIEPLLIPMIAIVFSTGLVGRLSAR